MSGNSGSSPEDSLCTALSLLLYGEYIPMNGQLIDDQKDYWSIDDEVIEEGLFIGEEKNQETPQTDTFDGGQQPETEDGDGSTWTSDGREEAYEQTQTVFMASVSPEAPPLPHLDREKGTLSTSPIPQGVFIRSDLSDEWIIA